jgi:phthiocerol/phenolphthiocerol synthesis type-I polyketide synthase E
LIATTGPGAMLAVHLAPDELRARLVGVDSWDLAAHNAEDESVLSGSVDALADVDVKLRADGVVTLPVEVTHAFHSRLLDPALAEYGEVIASVTRHAPSRPYISCVTGRWVTADQATSVDHWVQQARGTVLFASAVRTALDAGTSVFVQLGPGLMATSNLRRSRASAVVVTGDEYSPQEGVGQAWARGATIRRPIQGRRIGLPGYPFEHRNYSFAPAVEPGGESRREVVPQPDPTPPKTAASDSRRYPRPPLATPYRPAADALEARIIGLAEHELSTEGIGADDDLFELGWDSLLAIGLASRLSDDLGFEVDANAVYDAPTAALLAAALLATELEGLGADRENGG